MSRMFLISSFCGILCIVCIFMFYYIHNHSLNALFTSSLFGFDGNVDSNDQSNPMITTSSIDYSYVQPRCISRKNYTHIQSELTKVVERISKDWNIQEFPLFLSFMDIPASSWDIQKHKFIVLLLQQQYQNHHPFHNNNYHAVSRNKYVMGFSGSSVTAGHDSYFSEAYPNIVYEDMKGVFDAAGIELEVRNQALGNNPCYPYDACVVTHMGNDLDFLSWEQSMNCGRSARPVETFTRSALRMHRAPTVLYIASGTPAWNEGDCVNASHWPPHTLDKLEKELLSKSVRSAQSSKIMQDFSFLRGVSGKRIHEMYKGVAPMGQNVLPLQAYKCMGPYTAKFCQKTPGGGAPWHPGKLGHKLRGDNIAYFLLHIFADALKEVEKLVSESCAEVLTSSSAGDSAAGSSQSLESRPVEIIASHDVQVRRRLKENLPPRTHRTLLSTNVAEAPKAKKATRTVIDSLKFLRSKVDRTSLDANPIACAPSECEFEAICYTDYLPRATNNTITSLITSTDYVEGNLSYKSNNETSTILPPVNISSDVVSKGWTREISFFDANAVAKAESKHLGYKDRKNIFISHGIGSTISFSIEVSRLSAIWICECQKGFLKYPSTMTDLDKGAEVYLDSGGRLPLRPLIDQCYSTDLVAPGHHTLTIVQNSTLQVNAFKV